MKEKILLDTDIGTDLDDAVCLAYLLANPKCDLLGITTVTGQPVERAKLASALCKVAGRRVPIFPGVARPLLVPQMQTEARQAEALGKWEHADIFPDGQAIHFLRETIRQHPGEITLLAIGPMTNVGLLFAGDPKIPSLLKRLVLMCGVFTNRMAGRGPTEWNAKGDPHATAIVYSRGVAVHRSIGLDVTCRVTMKADEVRERFRAPLLQPVLDFSRVWFEHVERLTFHDPLAAATIFDDAICRFEPGTVDVELASPRLAGMTHWTPGGEDAPHEVALDVDVDRFIEHYFSMFE